MSARTDRIMKSRTLKQHREVITEERHDSYAGLQQVLNTIGDAITDLSCAVAALIDLELARAKRRKPKRRKKKR